MSTKLPDVVSRYFERDGDRDIESIVGLFAEDATVIDEGEERHGTAEIRAWQTGAASKYTYTTEITSAEALGAGDVMRAAEDVTQLAPRIDQFEPIARGERPPVRQDRVHHSTYCERSSSLRMPSRRSRT